MRITTWNVNSLKMRLERVLGWLERAQPDVLLMQETKLADAAVPIEPFAQRGYELVHHGEGGWNGVAIASRVGIAEVVTNFGMPLRAADTPETPDDEPLREARMISAVCGDTRVVSIYAPNGRTLGSVYYRAKLTWYQALLGWLRDTRDPHERLVIGGDYNVAPADIDVWDAAACHGGTHVSEPERAAFGQLLDWGLVDSYRKHHGELKRFSWWDYRAGCFQKNYGMRIDHLLVTAPLAEHIVWSEIDREARKGKPTPSDHAPVLIDVDAPGHPLDAGWAAAEERIAARRR
jgi:exodeoxyribonuclease-3